jgi:hypothetical protein
MVAYPNKVKPHEATRRMRARMRARPGLDGRDKGPPMGPQAERGSAVRARRRIDSTGKLTLRHRGRLHHVGVGRAHSNAQVIMVTAGLDIRVLSEDGELLRHLTLDPSRDYQPIGKPRARPKTSTMS